MLSWTSLSSQKEGSLLLSVLLFDTVLTLEVIFCVHNFSDVFNVNDLDPTVMNLSSFM